MIEVFFILTTIFVAYIVYSIIGEQKTTAKFKAPAAKPEALSAAVEQPKPEVAVAEEKPAATKPATVKPVAPKSVTVKPVTSKAAAIKAVKPEAAIVTKAPPTTKPAVAKKAVTGAAKSSGLKNPKTGEITSTYSNYRFTKRWIKEALVAEGLLEKVYPNNELNADTDAKIKTAIGKLEAMDKYKA